MVCRNCGRGVAEGSTSCRFCGEVFGAGAYQDEPVRFDQSQGNQPQQVNYPSQQPQQPYQQVQQPQQPYQQVQQPYQQPQNDPMMGQQYGQQQFDQQGQQYGQQQYDQQGQQYGQQQFDQQYGQQQYGGQGYQTPDAMQQGVVPGKKSLSKGALAGIVIGAVAVVAAIVVVIIMLLGGKDKDKDKDSSGKSTPESSAAETTTTTTTTTAPTTTKPEETQPPTPSGDDVSGQLIGTWTVVSIDGEPYEGLTMSFDSNGTLMLSQNGNFEYFTYSVSGREIAIYNESGTQTDTLTVDSISSTSLTVTSDAGEKYILSYGETTPVTPDPAPGGSDVSASDFVGTWSIDNFISDGSDNYLTDSYMIFTSSGDIYLSLYGETDAYTYKVNSGVLEIYDAGILDTSLDIEGFTGSSAKLMSGSDGFVITYLNSDQTPPSGSGSGGSTTANNSYYGEWWGETITLDEGGSVDISDTDMIYTVDLYEDNTYEKYYIEDYINDENGTFENGTFTVSGDTITFSKDTGGTQKATISYDSSRDELTIYYIDEGMTVVYSRY